MPSTKHTFDSRAGFFDALDRAIVDSRQLVGAPPFPPLESIIVQLQYMKLWTANGREPTREERRSITIGRIVVRELEPAATDELYAYGELIHELSFYFKLWWSDADWVSMDDKDPRLSFPDD